MEKKPEHGEITMTQERRRDGYRVVFTLHYDPRLVFPTLIKGPTP